MPFAAIAIHHPRPEHREDWMKVMRAVRQAPAPPGLISRTSYADTRSDRLIGISRWESREAVESVIETAIAGAAEYDRIWADAPTDVFVAEEFS
ncbi:MAG TPA: hypothetical protein VF193_03660 [Steroidobacter sp.]